MLQFGFSFAASIAAASKTQRTILLAACGKVWLLPIPVVAVRACRRHDVCGINNLVLIFGLCSLVNGHSGFSESLNEFRPIGILHWHGQTVRALAAWNREEVCRLIKSQRAVFHCLPFAIRAGQRIRGQGRIGAAFTSAGFWLW